MYIILFIIYLFIKGFLIGLVIICHPNFIIIVEEIAIIIKVFKTAHVEMVIKISQCVLSFFFLSPLVTIWLKFRARNFFINCKRYYRMNITNRG